MLLNEIFLFQFIKLASSFNTFHTKLSKARKRARNVFCCKINQSGVLFSFPSCDWLYFFQSWHILNGKTRAQVPRASSIECLECLVDLLHLWTLFATKQWLFAVKMYFYLREIVLMHLSRYEKNIACWQICQNFLKLCTIMCFSFWRADWAKLSDFTSAHNSRSPKLLVYLQVKDILHT